VLDELPSLEFAATAVAVVMALRALQLWRTAAPLRPRARIESARARDLIGVAILAVALLYAVRVERASTWFLSAIGVAIAALLSAFYTRAAASSAASGVASRGGSDPTIEAEEEGDEPSFCPSCGHGALIELDDPARLMGGLSALTPVAVAICPRCGALTGHVEDATKVPIGPAHGTSLRSAAPDAEREALEEPAEHDG
jgi:ribosomal protein S27AE